MLKKIMLLASMTVAAVAFTAPTAAQASGPNISGTDTFEGFLKQEIRAGFPGAGSTLTCEVTTHVEGLDGTTANVTTFNVLTQTCVGTGIYTDCIVKAESANVPWVAHSNTAHNLAVTKDGGSLTVSFSYEKCKIGLTGSHVLFSEMIFAPDPTEGAIQGFTVHATSTTGAITASGTMFGEEYPFGLFLFTP